MQSCNQTFSKVIVMREFQRIAVQISTRLSFHHLHLITMVLICSRANKCFKELCREEEIVSSARTTL